MPAAQNCLYLPSLPRLLEADSKSMRSMNGSRRNSGSSLVSSSSASSNLSHLEEDTWILWGRIANEWEEWRRRKEKLLKVAGMVEVGGQWEGQQGQTAGHTPPAPGPQHRRRDRSVVVQALSGGLARAGGGREESVNGAGQVSSCHTDVSGTYLFPAPLCSVTNWGKYIKQCGLRLQCKGSAEL